MERIINYTLLSLSKFEVHWDIDVWIRQLELWSLSFIDKTDWRTEQGFIMHKHRLDHIDAPSHRLGDCEPPPQGQTLHSRGGNEYPNVRPQQEIKKKRVLGTGRSISSQFHQSNDSSSLERKRSEVFLQQCFYWDVEFPSSPCKEVEDKFPSYSCLWFEYLFLIQ